MLSLPDPLCSCLCSRPSVRRKSKQALRDYKKVQIQLENLETSVRDRCKKEFTGKESARRVTLHDKGENRKERKEVWRGEAEEQESLF